MAAHVPIYWLGRAAYQVVWALQERLCARVAAGGPEVVLLCEHEPVITLGRRAGAGDLLVGEAVLAAHGIEQMVSDRGGQATYHGPGQLVIYPIVRLSRGVLHHVSALGQAAAAVAADLHVAAALRRDPVGVFVGPRKLAAIGVRVQRRVSTHGLALNVTAAATRPFRLGLFVPCGQRGAAVTSLEEESGRPDLLPARLAEALAWAFCQGSGRAPAAMQAVDNDSLLSDTLPVE